MTKATRDPQATEREMLDLLERMLTKHGNGGAGEYAFMRQVRNAAGFDAKRTFDGVSVGLWPSRGLDIHVYEVKVSRSDWQRELAKPQKAEDAAQVADRFTIVAPRDVVPVDEVPPTWGLIHAYGGIALEEELPPAFEGQLPQKVTRVEGRKLRVVRRAPLLRPGQNLPTSVPRSFLVPMLRAAGAVPDPVSPTQRQIDEAAAAAVARDRERAARDAELRGRENDSAVRILRRFRELSGVSLSHSNHEEQARRIKAALAIADEPERAKQAALRTLRQVADQMEHSLTYLRRVVEEGEADAEQMDRAQDVAAQALGAAVVP